MYGYHSTVLPDTNTIHSSVGGIAWNVVIANEEAILSKHPTRSDFVKCLRSLMFESEGGDWLDIYILLKSSQLLLRDLIC